jgi:DNA polymerase
VTTTIAKSLDELYVQYSEDPDFVHLKRGANRIVSGKGPGDPLVTFIGEAPGVNEDRTGEPFVGASGDLLNQLLTSIDLSRTDCYLTNIVKYRPKDNRDPTYGELLKSIFYVKEELSFLDCEIICPMGRNSLSIFFPEYQLREVHGHKIPWEGKTIVPLYHPAVALYTPSYKSIITNDFKVIGELLDESGR